MGSALSASLALALGLAAPTVPGGGTGELVQNAGQWPAPVAYATPDGGFWLTPDGWWTQRRTGTRGVAVRFRLEGADAARWLPAEPTDTRRHWFVGADAEAWVRGVRAFAAVRWPAVRPGVDLVVRSIDGRPRYDFELEPGADPSGLVVRVEGATRLALDSVGRLVVETPLGPLVQSPPIAWTATGDDVRVRFVLVDDECFTFRADAPPAARWTIDPVLVWSGFLGGSIEEEIVALDRLANGELVVAGRADSCDFPVTPGVLQTFAPGGLGDGFVSRLSADGTQLLSSTYVGGSDIDSLKGLAVGPGDTITVVGDSRSRDFPQAGSFGGPHSGAFDLFALRLTPAADTLVWSGLVGGVFNDRGNAVDVGADGSATVVGASNGFFRVTPGVVQPFFAGGQFSGDGVALRIRADGAALEWSTYLGSFGDDTATAVQVDASGATTIVGQAGGSNFPTTFGSFDTSFNGVRDGFVLRLVPSAQSLAWGSYLGGGGDDRVTALDVDASGRVSVAGTSDSTNLPVTAGAAQRANAGGFDAFVARLSADGQTLAAATYLGGERDDAAHGVRAETGGGFVVVGETLSAAFPTSVGAYDASYGGTPAEALTDAFVTRVDAPATSFAYSSFLGGGENDVARATLVVSDERVLIAGRTSSPDFPRTGGTFQSSFNFGSQGMGFLTRLNLFAQPVEYGAGKLSSLGIPPRIRWLGFPSLSDDDLLIGLDSALPFQPSVAFEGFASASFPWLGGTLLVQPPLRRIGTFRNDFVGYGAVPVPITPDMIGTTRFFQVWTSDPLDPVGAVMTPGLMVRFHP